MTKLKLEGIVGAVVSSEFEGKVSKKLQFINQTEKGIKVLSIKLNETQTISEIEQGTKVSVEVAVSTMKDSFDVFYKQVGELKIRK